MAKHLAIERNTLYPQPGSKIKVDKEGKWTATEIYHVHRLDAVKLMPRTGTVHPEVAFISVVDSEIEFGEADLAVITSQYSGAEDTGSGNEKANATYSMDIALSEEHLLLCHHYKDIGTKEREALKGIIAGKDKDDQGNKLRDKVTSALGIDALSKIDRGQVSYYCPKITWKEKWVCKRSVSADELNRIGKIDTPNGPCPALAGTRNWLRNGCTQDQEGKHAFTLQLEWLASNEDGWDSQIYAHS